MGSTFHKTRSLLQYIQVIFEMHMSWSISSHRRYATEDFGIL